MVNINWDDAKWHKSTFSGAQGGCVEIAKVDGYVAVRHSKQHEQGVIVYTEFEWDVFKQGVLAGEF